MQLPAATSDSLLTVFDFVGGQDSAPLPGGELLRSSAQTESFGDLLSSLDIGHSADASPSGPVKLGSESTEASGDVTDELLNPPATIALAALPLVPSMIPPAPPRTVEHAPEFDLGQSPDLATRTPPADTGTGLPAELPADSVPNLRQLSDTAHTTADAAARTTIGRDTVSTQNTKRDANGAAMQTGSTPPSRIDEPPSRESPADEVNPAHSLPTGRTIAPARDGESSVRNGAVDASASRVWTFFPAAKGVRRPAAERTAHVDPVPSGALPISEAAAAAPAVPLVAVEDVRPRPAVSAVSEPAGTRVVANDESSELGRMASDWATGAVSPSLTASESSQSSVIEMEPVADPGIPRESLTKNAVAEPAIQGDSGVPRPMPPNVAGGQLTEAGVATLSQANQTLLPARGNSISPEVGVDDPSARIRPGNARSSLRGEALTDPPDIEVQAQQAHSLVANAIEAAIAAAESFDGPQHNLGALGDVDPAASGAASPLTGAEHRISEPATAESTVVQQIGEAVEAWRDALQEQGTARFSAWLTPPDLGHVWIELTRSTAGLTARLIASDDSVQSLLETQAPELRQALSDSGVTVTELDLSGRPAGDFASSHERQPPERHSEPEPAAERDGAPAPRRPTLQRPRAVDVRA